MLIQDIRQDISFSLKRRDTVRLDTLRFLLAAINNATFAKYGRDAETKGTDADVLEVVKKQVKTHRESIEAFEKAGRTELVQKEKKELEILSSFLPKEMTDEELKNALSDIVSTGESTLPAGRQDFGLLMKSAMAKVEGRADGGRVASILKQLLQNNSK